MLSNLPRASITPWLHAALLPFLNYFWYEEGIEIGSQTSLKTSQRGGYNGTQTLASMVSKISGICLTFKETRGVRRTRKLGELDLDTGTSFVPTGKLWQVVEKISQGKGGG